MRRVACVACVAGVREEGRGWTGGRSAAELQQSAKAGYVSERAETSGTLAPPSTSGSPMPKQSCTE